MKRKITGSTTAAITVFVISGILASFLGARQYDRLTTHEVIGVNGAIVAGQVISPSMLRTVKVGKDVQGLKDPRQIVGKQSVRNYVDGDLVQLGDLKRPARSWLSQKVPEGMVLYTLSPQANSLPHSQLNKGDVFDVLVTGSFGVRTVARNVKLVGVLNSPLAQVAPKTGGMLAMASQTSNKRTSNGRASLVVAIDPVYVYPLASVSNYEQISIVLHGSGTGVDKDRLQIEPKRTKRSVEILSGLSRRSVNVSVDAF